MTEKIVITGSSGLIGRNLVKELLSRGCELICIDRKPMDVARLLDGQEGVSRISCHTWDKVATSSFREELEGTKAVVHLAGEPVLGLWTSWKKRRIFNSRVETTELLVRIIESLHKKPSLFISAGATGYYGDRNDELLVESSGPGRGFLTDVCMAWEEAGAKVEQQGCRFVVLRLGLVLSEKGGVLPVLKRLATLCVGKMGSGTQWWPWIHIKDVTRIVVHVLEREWQGSFNVVAPEPATQGVMATSLSKVLNRRILFHIPEFLIKMTGDSSSELLNSKKVVPQKLLDQGFTFKYPTLDEALKDLAGG